MPTLHSHPGRGASGHRRTVRIVKPRTYSKTAIISLSVLALAALCLPGIWHVSRREKPEEGIVRRELGDVELTWRCAAGHTFRAAGQVESRLCWTCDRMSFPQTRYTCQTHGSFKAVVKFAHAEDGVPHVSEVRLIGRDWVKLSDGLKCPRCTNELIYLPPDPLETLRRRQGRVGGQ